MGDDAQENISIPLTNVQSGQGTSDKGDDNHGTKEEDYGDEDAGNGEEQTLSDSGNDQSVEGTSDKKEGHHDTKEEDCGDKASENGEEQTPNDEVVEAPKYIDRDKLAEVLEGMEEKVYDNETAVARLNVKMYEMKSQILKINDELDRIEPLPEEPVAQKDDFDLPELKFVSREEWGAHPPWSMETLKALSKPVSKVNVTFSTDTLPCESQEECLKTVVAIQKRQMQAGIPDIAHNFLIGEDGYVYEGRGWHLTPYIDHYPSTEEVLDVAYIGSYNPEIFPFSQLNMLMSLLKKGVDEDYVHEDHEMFHICNGEIISLD